MVYSRHERGHGVDKKVNLTARTYTKRTTSKVLKTVLHKIECNYDHIALYKQLRLR